ncbi:P-loop containing nucleoside triphosphate hydrolase, partial [Trinorchestia longiramus]
EKVLKETRQCLQRRLQNYSFHPSLGIDNATQLTPTFGGRPVINLLVTTWRSGSSFVGDLLSAHPATMYHYEPFHVFGITRPKHGHMALTAQRYLNHLLTCNYSQMDQYINHGKKNQCVFNKMKSLWSVCSKSRNLCQSSDFLSRFCALFPFQLTKTVRMPLNLTEEFLKNVEFDVRVLLLVRDPRGTMQSRKHLSWCRSDNSCRNPAALCDDLVNDYQNAQKLYQLFPDRVR